MTAQTLYGTLQFLDVVDRELELQAHLDSLRSHLDNLVAAPAQPQHQSALASELKALTEAYAQLSDRITPSRAVLINEIGGGEFFDPNIADKVRRAVSTNAMTPSVARDFVQDLTTKRTAFLSTVRKTLQGLSALKITEADLKPGSADLTFLIPRDLFKNHLGPFAKELSFINHLIRNFSEAATGHPEDVEVETLSSSIPTVALLASAPVILAIANIVSKFLDAWKKVEEIREIRGRLTKMGLSENAEQPYGENHNHHRRSRGRIDPDCHRTLSSRHRTPQRIGECDPTGHEKAIRANRARPHHRISGSSRRRQRISRSPQHAQRKE